MDPAVGTPPADAVPAETPATVPEPATPSEPSAEPTPPQESAAAPQPTVAAPRPAAVPQPRLRPGRMLADLLFIVATVALTLLAFRWYLSARASLIPALVTPRTDFVAASRPGAPAVIGRMKDMALARLGLHPADQPKVVAFTFDDGPYPLLTPVLLDLLARNHVKATFFIIGRDAQMQPEIVRRMVMEGHELGNHSYTHSSLEDLDTAGIHRELDQTDLLIRGLTGVRTRLLRPPGGRLDPEKLRLVQSMGYTVALDNINPGDWREGDPLTIYNYTLWRNVNGAIVLMHSGRTGTIRALPTIIDAYRKKGYRFVTVSELARVQGIDLGSEPPRAAAR